MLTGDRPEDPYIGTLDVDLVVDPISVPDEVYRTIAELLRERGYVQLDQPFRWLRPVEIDGRSIDVEVDLLAPATPRSGTGHRHERIGGEPLARRTEGAELVRSGHVEREIAGVLPDGRPQRVSVRVATPAALVILKALAIGQRDKPKDAYDIDYVLRHIGVEEVVAGIQEFGAVEPVMKALAVLTRSSVRSTRSGGDLSSALASADGPSRRGRPGSFPPLRTDRACVGMPLGRLADGERRAERVPAAARLGHAAIAGPPVDVAPRAVPEAVKPDSAAWMVRAARSDDGRIELGACHRPTLAGQRDSSDGTRFPPG